MALSLADAIRLAQTSSALNRAAVARVAGAKARLRGRRSLESPSLNLARNYGSSEVATDEGVLLTQTVEVGRKRARPIRSAQAERETAAAEAEQPKLEVTRAVTESYCESLQAEADRGLAADALHTAEAFAQAAQVQFEAGDVARNQVVRGQIEVTQAQQELASAESELATSQSELRSLLGLPDGAVLTLTDALPTRPQGYAAAELEAQAMRDRPDLRAARSQEAAREADVQAARAQPQPDLLWELRHDAVLAKAETGLRVGISFPLLDLGKQRAAVQEAEAALVEQRATREEAERTARLEIERARLALELARTQLASFGTGRVERAKELLTMAQIEYQQGGTSYLEMLDAQQAYRTEQVALVQAQTAYRLAQAALEQAVGGKLP